METKSNEAPKARRGFACMSVEQRTAIAAKGGSKTVRRHGRRYMAAIGKKGRRKRTRLERAARREALAKAA